MSLNVIAEPATVYRARSGRRYLTRHGALIGSMNWLIRKHCYCESGWWEGSHYIDGTTCHYHDPEKSAALRKRLARHLAYNDSRSR